MTAITPYFNDAPSHDLTPLGLHLTLQEQANTAIKNGDLETIQQIHDIGYDFNHSYDAIFDTVCDGNTHATLKLIELNALDLSKKHKLYNAPLFLLSIMFENKALYEALKAQNTKPVLKTEYDGRYYINIFNCRDIENPVWRDDVMQYARNWRANKVKSLFGMHPK